MVYVRGQPADFDDWAAAGNPGWSWRDVLPYFIKFEDHAWGASAYHGAGGPVHVSDESASVHPLCHTFLRACEELGIPGTKDFNGAKPRRRGPVAGHHQGRRAGLERQCLPGGGAATRQPPGAHPGARHPGAVRAARARAAWNTCRRGRRAARRRGAEVLVCGGAINSPQLLELSGVGDGTRLRELGIAVVADSPAVGEGLQDHLGGLLLLSLAGADAQQPARTAVRQGARGAGATHSPAADRSP